MTLYAKQGRSYRPATEAEILSAYGSVMAARRKSKSGGPKQKLSERQQSAIRTAYPMMGIDALTQAYGVSTRTIRRILAEEES